MFNNLTKLRTLYLEENQFIDATNKSKLVQLIDGEGYFDKTTFETFVKEVKLAECGFSYSVVSIMGPQSSGKSTLLNHLFGTNFREMDCTKERSQTTKGIWLTKCDNIERCTIVMDLEGCDGRERGEDDTAFEKQTALFGLAISDIIIINMWCHDIGREHAANKPLLRTILEVMGKQFGFSKATLLFVLRDKPKSSPMEVLEKVIWEDIRQIWNSIDKLDGIKEDPMDKFFNVNIMAFPSYEDKIDQFLDQVDSLRQQFFDSDALEKLAQDRREAVVPGSGFCCSLQEIWKVIRENKEFNLPSLKAVVANICCEEIAQEKLNSLIANVDWRQLNMDLQYNVVPQFGMKVSSLLDICLLEYDAETKHFNEGIQKKRRSEFMVSIKKLVKPAYKRMLEHSRSRIWEQLEEACKKKLSISIKIYDMNAEVKSLMTQYDEECKDAIVKHANWNSSKERDKLKHDMGIRVTEISLQKEREIQARKSEFEDGLKLACGIVTFVDQSVQAYNHHHHDKSS